LRDDDDGGDWKVAEAALEKARSLPAGAARIEALRRAGKLRFAADRGRHNKKQGKIEPESKSPKPNT
jgi:hypothetical protein